MSALNVVYTPVEELDSSVDLENFGSSSSYMDVTPTRPIKKRQKRESGCFKSFCACVGVTVTLTFITFLLMSSAGYYMFKQEFRQCFDSEHFDYELVEFPMNTVHTIDFSLVNGLVVIYEKEDIDNLQVHLGASARSENLLQQVSLELLEVDGKVSVISQTPNFDFTTCQYVSVVVYLPLDHEAISVTGDVQLGVVDIGALTVGGFEDIDMDINLGYASVYGVNAQSIALKTKLGLVEASDSTSDSVHLEAGVGGVYSVDNTVADLTSKVEIGSSWIEDTTVTSTLKSGVHYGYNYLLRPQMYSNLEENTSIDISVDTFYGKAVVVADRYVTSEVNLINVVGTQYIDGEGAVEEDGYRFVNDDTVNGGKILVTTDYGTLHYDFMDYVEEL
eukprot:TRINITY_DN513_c0_g3_i1.p1 TRINITY_DN513_c0_g3~~TRINITY_DN513_c0_g3_i1.p1  ORF type:complete len:401 (-),score=112.07 TRINITY_DN513_c0_g3_i1:53-1222(-)